MIAKISALILFFSSLSLHAQSPPAKPNQQSKEDQLIKHVSAAETYQISGDLVNAGIENRAVAAIALQRIGNIYIEEGKFQEAARILSESRSFNDDAHVRLDLAIAYLRMNEVDKALEEAKAAVSQDPKNAYARYVLGNAYFTKEDYKAALPELEKVLILGPNFDAAHALGLTYLHLKQLERAKLLFEEIQNALKKENPDLHVLFGQAYEQTNYPLEAEREFKRALAINPKQPRANFYLGFVILQHGGSERLAEAGSAFEKELELTPNDFYSNFFAGVAASSMNDHAKAIGFLEKAVQANPKSAEAHLFLGQSQLELGRLESAEKTLRRAADLAVDDPKGDYQSRRTHFLLGRLFIRTGRKEEGEKELAIARRLQEKLLDSTRDEIAQILGQVVKAPKVSSGAAGRTGLQTPAISPVRAAELVKLKSYLSEILAQAFHNLGVIAAQNGNLQDSLDKFAATSAWKADFPGLDRNWGIVAFRAAQFEKAEPPLSRHLKANPKDDLVRQMVGTIHYFSKDYRLAAETLKPIESSLVSKPELAYFYGIALIQLQRNSEANSIFDRLAATAKSDPEALSYAAQGFMLLGDYERAVREFRAVAAAAPQLEKTYAFMGQSLIRLNRYDEAEQAFRRALELNPSDDSSKYHLAFTLIERKVKPDEAESLLKEAVALRADYAEAHYQLGKIYNEKNLTEKAIEHLEAAARADKTKDYIYYQLSIAYRRAERKAESEQALKTYQELKAANRKSETPSPMGGTRNEPK